MLTGHVTLVMVSMCKIGALVHKVNHCIWNISMALRFFANQTAHWLLTLLTIEYCGTSFYIDVKIVKHLLLSDTADTIAAAT